MQNYFYANQSFELDGVSRRDGRSWTTPFDIGSVQISSSAKVDRETGSRSIIYSGTKAHEDGFGLFRREAGTGGRPNQKVSHLLQS